MLFKKTHSIKMIAIQLPNIEFNIPSTGADLSPKKLKALMGVKLKPTSVAKSAFLCKLMPKKAVKAIGKLSEEDFGNFWYQLFNETSLLFDSLSLPKGFTINRKTLPPLSLTSFTYGQWCLLAETSARLEQETNAADIETINNLMLGGAASEDVTAIPTHINLKPWQQLLILEYAQKCLTTVLKLNQYQCFFEPEKKQIQTGSAPAFGWFSLNNENKPLQEAFGGIQKLLQANLHLVLIFLTDQKNAHKKQQNQNQLEELKSKK